MLLKKIILPIFLVFCCIYSVDAQDSSIERNLDSTTPKTRDEFFFRGVDYCALGLFDKALLDLQEALKIDPFFEKSYNYLGIIYSRKKEHKKALINFEKAIEIEPMFANACQNLGRLYLEMGDSKKAIRFLKRSRFLQIDNPMNHYLLGVAYYLNGRINMALKEYENALEQSPSLLNGQLYYNLGVCNQELGRYREALRYYKIVLEMDPFHKSTLSNQAICNHVIGNSDLAINILTDLLKKEPANLQHLLNMANIYLDLKAYKKAEIIYQFALSGQEDGSFREMDKNSVFNSLGMLYSKTDRMSKAIETWKEVCKRDENNIQALNNLANAYLKERNFQEAIVCLKKLVKLKPENGGIWNALGYTLIDQKQELEYGKFCVDKAIALDPSNHAIYLDSLGWYYFRVGKLPEARKLIKRALDILEISNEGKSSEIYYHLAQIHRNMKNSEGEEVNLRQALLAEPKSHFANLAHKDLIQLTQKASSFKGEEEHASHKNILIERISE
ncbi:tetratricopeptide repeat protein [Candidatus Riflebacteria bacterium]